MMPLDVALCLFLMVDPQYQYYGTVTDNLESSYNAIRWEDERQKPTWQQLNTWWTNNQATIAPYFEEKPGYGIDY